MFNFLHLELTSRCNKNCACCGRRKIEIEYPEIATWGDMPFWIVKQIAYQVPRGTVVQFHNNGESLLYPYLNQALVEFNHCIRQFNTNGKLLLEKADEIIGNLEVLTISVIEKDTEAEEQYEIVKEFLKIKENRIPRIVYRLLGKCEEARYRNLPGQIARRTLHSPDGSREYVRPVTMPEIGICLDLLTHLAIDRYGNISLCVRFDPKGNLRLGNIQNMTLEEAWNGDKRRLYLENHVKGHREFCPGCDRCEYFGIARGE